MAYQKYLAPDEKPIWVIQPNQLLFVIVYGALRTPLMLGLLFPLAFILISSSSDPRALLNLFTAKNILLCASVSFVLILIFLNIVHSNTFYILTSQRLILTGGIFGTEVKSIELEQITDIHIAVNPIDHIFHSGRISVSTAGSHVRQSMYENTLLALDQPERVFNSLRATLKTRTKSSRHSG